MLNSNGWLGAQLGHACRAGEWDVELWCERCQYDNNAAYPGRRPVRRSAIPITISAAPTASSGQPLPDEAGVPVLGSAADGAGAGVAVALAARGWNARWSTTVLPATRSTSCAGCAGTPCAGVSASATL